MQPSRPCKGCSATIYRTNTTAPVRHYCGPECRPRCSIEDCEKPAHSKGWCSAHATRAARFGDPLAPKTRGSNGPRGPRGPRKKVIPLPCSVEGCGQPMRKMRFCASHYAMQYKHGEIRDWHHKWGEGGYNPVHRTLRRLRGKAATHACADCGNAAQEWSYNGGDPDEITDAQGRTFTRNPDAYSPRCVACHRLFDENPIAMRRMP